MLKIRSIYYLIPIRRTMEDLESAIYSLKEALEEHFTVDRSSMVTVFSQDNIHDTLIKLIEKVDVLEELIMTMVNLDETVTTLADTMKQIAEIQGRALKWQEMSQ